MSVAASNAAPSRRERRRRELHERIVEAAIALFERKGFTDTTALEIAQKADIAEKTFYNHFPTKQHLIQELAERSLDDTVALLAEARRFPGSTAARLSRFFELSAEAARNGSRELAREVLLELVRVAQVDGVGPEHHRRLHSAFAVILEDGRARADVADDRNLEFVTELAVAAYLGIVINWVTLPDYPIRERLASLAALVGEMTSGAAALPPKVVR